MNGVELAYREDLYPLGRYAPWLSDAEFQEVFRAVKEYTMVDEIRLYELWSLARQGGKGDLLEVGVWRGGSGALLAKATGAHTYLCDTFQGVAKASALDTHYEGGEHADASREDVESLLRNMKLDNAIVVEGIFPDETGPALADMRFRFCHIDIDVYAGTRDVIQWVWPRLLPGGVLVFDDYGFPATDGVTRAVNEVALGQDRTFAYNQNGHGLLFKKGKDATA